MSDSQSLSRPDPPLWRSIAIFICGAGLFLFLNRTSYSAWFYGDDLATLTWARTGHVKEFLSWLITPRISDANFRPVGAFYYRILGGSIGLWYPPYVAVIQAVHLLNVVLLYLLLRRLKLSWFASAAGSAFFLFHVATMDVFWKPMYVFDLLCATFCLLTLLLYIDGRWILAIIAFWLAFKAKEVAILLPFALATYEWMFGSRQWKRLIPFALISLNFGLQGFITHLHTTDSYTFRFTPADLATTATYYATELVFNPFVVLAALPLLALARDRRVFFGALTALFLLFPLLLLPGRMFSAYWYAPLIGVCVMFGALADRAPRWVLVAGLACWMFGNFELFLPKEQAILAAAADNRAYFETVAALARRDPNVRLFGYEQFPQEMYMWGAEASVNLICGYRAKAYPADGGEWQAVRNQDKSCLLKWLEEEHRLVTTCTAPAELHSSR